MHRLRVAFGLLVLAGSPQDKPAASVADIIECVKANACRNAVASTLSWADVGGIDVQALTDGNSTYAVALSRDGSLNIWVTLPGETRAGRVITLGAHGRVLSAELGRQPGENFPMRMTPEQTAERRALRKAYLSTEHASAVRLGTWGEQFKSFWQEQADAAVAAIRRRMQTTDALADIFACAAAQKCRNMRVDSVRWFDQFGIPVVSFTEERWSYAIRVARDGRLSVWITQPGESGPSRLVSVGSDGKVTSGELHVVPSGGGWPRRLTPEETAKWHQDAKILSPPMGSRGAVGEEFRTFWQEQADRAIASTRRQLAR